MNKRKSLIKNSIILLIGNYVPKFVSMISLPIVTARLSQSEYGTFDIINTLISLILPALILQIHTALFRFLIDCRDNEDEMIKTISTVVAYVIPISIIGTLGTLLCMNTLYRELRFVVTCYFIFDIYNAVLGQVARGLSKNLIYSFSSIIISVTNMALIVFLLLGFDAGLEGVLWASAIAQLLSVIYMSCVLKIKKYLNLRQVSVSKLKEMLLYSWPMVPNAMSTWILSLSDKLVITAFLGTAANGIYAIALKIPNLFFTAQNVINMAWQENAAIAVKDSDREKYYTAIFDMTLRFYFGVISVLMGASPYIFKILINSSYSDAYYQMPILFIAFLFQALASFFGGIYVAHRQTKSVGLTTMVAAGVNLLVDLSLIRFIGITAGSVSTLVAFIFLCFYRMLRIKKFQSVRIKRRQFVIYLSVLTSIAAGNYINTNWSNFILLIFTIIFAIVINRGELGTIINIVKEHMKERS